MIQDTIGKLKGPVLIAYRVMIIAGGILLFGTFVTKREYEGDKAASDKWNTEVIKRLDARADVVMDDVGEVKRLVERMNDKLDRLVERRAQNGQAGLWREWSGTNSLRN